MLTRLSVIAMLFWVLTCSGAEQWQHALILEPAQGVLHVSEMWRLESPADETVQVYIPEAGLTSAQATMQGPNADRQVVPLEKTGERGVYRLHKARGKGFTAFEVAYSVPMTGKFIGRTFGSAPLWLISDMDVALAGDAVRLASRDPRSGANLYRLVEVRPGAPFEVLVTAAAPSEPTQPQRGPARVLQRLPALLVLTCAVLAAGGARLYRRQL